MSILILNKKSADPFRSWYNVAGQERYELDALSSVLLSSMCESQFGDSLREFSRAKHLEPLPWKRTCDPYDGYLHSRSVGFELDARSSVSLPIHKMRVNHATPFQTVYFRTL